MEFLADSGVWPVAFLYLLVRYGLLPHAVQSKDEEQIRTAIRMRLVCSLMLWSAMLMFGPVSLFLTLWCYANVLLHVYFILRPDGLFSLMAPGVHE